MSSCFLLKLPTCTQGWKAAAIFLQQTSGKTGLHVSSESALAQQVWYGLEYTQNWSRASFPSLKIDMGLVRSYIRCDTSGINSSLGWTICQAQAKFLQQPNHRPYCLCCLLHCALPHTYWTLYTVWLVSCLFLPSSLSEGEELGQHATFRTEGRSELRTVIGRRGWVWLLALWLVDAVESGYTPLL